MTEESYIRAREIKSKKATTYELYDKLDEISSVRIRTSSGRFEFNIQDLREFNTYIEKLKESLTDEVDSIDKESESL